MSKLNVEQRKPILLGELLIHPRYIMRVAGEPANLIKNLESGITHQLLNQSENIIAQYSHKFNELADKLEVVIPTLEDKQASRAAINIRRSLFNRRSYKNELLHQLSRHLPLELLTGLKENNEHLREAELTEQKAIKAYDDEMLESAPEVVKLLTRDNLMSGLSYSNPALYIKLCDAYLSETPRKLNRKSARNLEDALLQYYARCSTKTSPLSSFTVAHVGKWQDSESAENTWKIEYQNTLDRRVEFKAGLIRYLMAPLINNFASASQLFPLRLNSSIRHQDGKVKMYGITPGQEGNGRTFGTGLVQSELSMNAVLNCINHVFAGVNGQSLTTEKICHKVCELAPKLAISNVNQFLERLYQLNYLVADTNELEQQDHLDWASSIVEKISAVMGPAANNILQSIKVSLAQLALPDCENRVEMVMGMRNKVEEFAELMGADKNNALFRPSFYENCYLTECKSDLSTKALNNFKDELTDLHKVSLLLDFNQEVRGYLTDFFIAKFGEDGVCHEPEKFLEAFDDVYSPGVMGAQIDADKIAPNSPLSQSLFDAKSAFDDYLEPLLQQSENVELSSEKLGDIFNLIPPCLSQRGSSYSYVVQVAEQGEDSKLILNQVFGGRSSIMSRFMEVLDEEELNEVRQYLGAGARNNNYAELSGVFGFNANRHPVLSEQELEVAPFSPSRSETSKLKLSDLSLSYDKATHAIVFNDTNGDALDIWYQGLLIPSLLPRMHRILSLAFTDGPSLTIIKSLIERNMISSAKPTIVPRVSLGNLVLFRRTWIMPNSYLPNASTSASDFYFLIQQWQKEFSLPDEFFVRALPLMVNEDGEPQTNTIDWDKVNFKDMKPFYVDLKSPRFVRLMQRMLKRNEFTICISELLPKLSGYQSHVGDDAHVSELHFELTAINKINREKVMNWNVIRIAYFNQDRSELMLGPIKEAIAIAKSKSSVTEVMVQPHWKFGPHIDLSIKCDKNDFHAEILPKIKACLEQWFKENPSDVVLEDKSYQELSKKIGMFELDAGPYLPLLKNNSVSVVNYQSSQNLIIPEFAASKEKMLSDSLDLLMNLLQEKQKNPDDFFLALVAILSISGNSYRPKGLIGGYMSLRSHADYFFAAHDSKGQLRQHFDNMDNKKGSLIDDILRCCCEQRFDDLPLNSSLKNVVGQWQIIVDEMSDRHQEIVAEHYDYLAQQSVHIDAAEAMKDNLPEDFRQVFESKEITELGEYFLNSEEGLKAQKAPEFMAYRTNVNFFYFLLPIIEVSPIQKFCLCHLVANGAERIFQQNWRVNIGLASEEELV